MKKYKPLICILKEGNIFPKIYCDKILEKIDLILLHLKNQKFSAQEICDIFNKYLLMPHQILFEIKDNIFHEGYPINRGNFIKEGDVGLIIITCNPLLENIQNSKEDLKIFKDDLRSTLYHEMIHRKQFLKIKSENLEKVLEKYKNQIMGIHGATSSKELTNLKMKNYLGNNFEIMSFAHQIVEFFKVNNFTDSQMLKMIKDNELRSYSYILGEYYKYFTIEDIQMKKLYKYIYVYLDNFNKL